MTHLLDFLLFPVLTPLIPGGNSIYSRSPSTGCRCIHPSPHSLIIGSNRRHCRNNQFLKSPSLIDRFLQKLFLNSREILISIINTELVNQLPFFFSHRITPKSLVCSQPHPQSPLMTTANSRLVFDSIKDHQYSRICSFIITSCNQPPTMPLHPSPTISTAPDSRIRRRMSPPP